MPNPGFDSNPHFTLKPAAAINCEASSGVKSHSYAPESVQLFGVVDGVLGYLDRHALLREDGLAAQTGVGL